MIRCQRYRALSSIIHRCLSSDRPTLYETLRVVESSPNVFIQPAESLFVYPHRTSVFGGQIIGSAIYAVQQTLNTNVPLHSLHAYFLAAADNTSAISYTVQRLRDGKSFQSRSVTARQDEKIIFECQMSFHRQEQGTMEHQPTMPSTGNLFVSCILMLIDGMFLL
jgi:acyl-CoA thioesterase II